MRSDDDSKKEKKSLIQLAKNNLTSDNPSLLGDPVSLKAEAANSHPTEHDRGAAGVKPEVTGTTEREAPRESGTGGGKVVGTGGGGGQGKGGEGKKLGLAGDKNLRVGDAVGLGIETVDSAQDKYEGKKGGKGSKL